MSTSVPSPETAEASGSSAPLETPDKPRLVTKEASKKGGHRDAKVASKRGALGESPGSATKGRAGQLSDQDLAALAEQMQREISIKTRRHKLQRHKTCFRGSHATSWLIGKGHAASRAEAAELGDKLLRLGRIYHVTHRHGFSDKSRRLYRFQSSSSSSDAESLVSDGSNCDDAKRVNEMFDSMWARGSVVKLRSEKAGSRSVGGDVTKLQARVLDILLDIEDQKEMTGILLDSISGQIRGMQVVTKLLTEKLSKANERIHTLKLLSIALASVQLLTLLWVFKIAPKPPQLLTFAMLAAALCVWLWLSWKRGVLTTGCSSPFAEGSRSAFFWESQAVAEKLESGKKLLRMLKGRSPEIETTASRRQAHGPLESATESRRATADTEGSFQDLQDSDPGSSEGEIPGERLEGNASSSSAGSVEQPPPDLKDFAEWPDAPLLIRPRVLPYQQCRGLVSGGVPANTGRRIEFQTELFEGCAVIWIQGLGSAPKDLFEGQRRKTSITFQGRFKRAASLDDIITGQEFSRPAVNLPAKWLVESVLIKIARSISPSMSIGPMSAPFVLVPVVAAAQEINVSLPGEEPDPAKPVPEDMRLFDVTLVDKNGSPLQGTKRKKFFWDAKHRHQQFTTEHVWTFTLYQSQVDMSRYELDVALKFDLTRNLDGQPLQFMAKDRVSGSYLFKFEAWHERLLPAAERAWKQLGEEGQTTAVR